MPPRLQQHARYTKHIFATCCGKPLSYKNLGACLCVGDHAAVLCGKQWIALPQLLNLKEAQRIGGGVAAAGGVSVRTGHRDEFNELVGTLATEIARRLPRYPVFLQVYDLVQSSHLHAYTCTWWANRQYLSRRQSQAKSISGLNRLTNGIRIGGMFHGGVEIHGLEWSFGWADEGYSGVFECEPTMNELHSYKEVSTTGACPINRPLRTMHD